MTRRVASERLHSTPGELKVLPTAPGLFDPSASVPSTINDTSPRVKIRVSAPPSCSGVGLQVPKLVDVDTR